MAQGSHTGSQGMHARGSQGMHATGSQGLQPFHTTERRPKMPASAVVVAASTMIAVNVDNKSLCFISILLKKRLGKTIGNDCHSFVTGGYRIKLIRSSHGYERFPVLTFAPLIGTQETDSPSFLASMRPLHVRHQSGQDNMIHNSQKSNFTPQKGEISATRNRAKPNPRYFRYRTNAPLNIREKEKIVEDRLNIRHTIGRLTQSARRSTAYLCAFCRITHFTK